MRLPDVTECLETTRNHQELQRLGGSTQRLGENQRRWADLVSLDSSAAVAAS